MKRLLILSIIFSFSQLYAQTNLVKNAGFEDYIYCPHAISMVSCANYWSAIVDTTYIADSQLIYNGIMGTIAQWDANCIPYYCNACDNLTIDPSGNATVPLGTFWNHYPRTGNGMMMMIMYEDLGLGHSYRYYLQGRLIQTLTAGQAYCVSFYVVNTHYSGNGCNHIGAYFDDGSIDTTTECGYVHTQYTPQVYTDSIITDTTNWTKIEGSFVANGTEKFITIGNFFDNAHTSLLPSNAHGAALHAYYLIDDVSVTATSAVANAGPDKVIPPGGDSVLIGTGTGYLPCYWYANGVLIDSNVAGIKVKPLTTTHYVIELNICGHSYDTVVVYVWKAGVNDPAPVTALQLYPNPTTGNLTIEGAAGCSVDVYDMVGRVQNCNGMYSCRGSAGLTMTGLPLAGLTMTGIHTITGNKETIDISNLQKGIYIVEVVYEDGERVRRRVVKE